MQTGATRREEGNQVVDRNEAALIGRAQGGDVAAFGALVAIHGKRVYRLAYRFCWNEDDADDIAQETLIRAFQYIRGFRQGSRFAPWLHRITVNVSLAHRGRRERAHWSAALTEPRAGVGDEGLADRIATSSRVQEEIRRLPERQRAAVVLFELEGLSVDETAGAMGCSAGSVKRHLHRARRTLRAGLADLVEDTLDAPGGARDELQDSSADDGLAGGSATTG